MNSQLPTRASTHEVKQMSHTHELVHMNSELPTLTSTHAERLADASDTLSVTYELD